MVEWRIGKSTKTDSSLRFPDSIVGITQLASILSASHRPSVLISEREISVLRRGLTKDGWKRNLYLEPADEHPYVYSGAGILSLANKFLEKEIVIPERGGHYHNFFCECGKRLIIPEDLQPQKEYLCPDCGKSWSGEKYDGAIRYLQHQNLAAAVLALSIVYSIERERVYSDKAAEILLKYSEAYPGPHTDTTTGGMLFQSLCEAVWAIPLAQSYDLIYYSRSLSEKQRSIIEETLFRPMAEGLRSVGINGNWGSWHLSAVGVIGFAIKDASLVKYALESFKSQISEQLGDDGLWPESVHTYHFYALSAFVHFAEACYRSGIDIYNWQARPGKSLKSMFTAPLQYAYPSLRLPAINDGWYDSFMPLSLYEVAFRRWNDPQFAWILKKAYKYGESPINEDQVKFSNNYLRRSFYSFLFGRDLPGRSCASVFKSVNYRKYGVCVLKSTDDMMATFHYGPFLGHGHLDKMSFTLYANNSIISPDYGTPGYGSDILPWYSGTASHNTVIVDGVNQQPSREYSLSKAFNGSFLQVAKANCKDSYPNINHFRKMLLIGGIMVVIDELTGESEHTYDWLMRFEGDASFAENYNQGTMDCSAYTEVKARKVIKTADACHIDAFGEYGRLDFRIWSDSKTMDVALVDSPAETAQRRVPMIICRSKGKKTRFISVIAPLKKDEKGLERDGCVIKSERKNNTIYLYTCSDNEESQNILQTNGEIAAVMTTNGEVTAIALINGSWIKWMGRVILECPSQVDCVEVCFREHCPIINYCGDIPGNIKIKTSARAMRVNGHRTAAMTTDGQALLRVTPHMLINNEANLLS